MKNISILSLLFFLFLVMPGRAQEPDSLDAVRTFVQVCNTYKQLPLQMTLGIHNTTNLVTGAEDTVQARATFYLQQHGSYIRFGELEQVANDSLMLLVSDNLKQM